MIVHVSSHLYGYTHNRPHVQGRGATVGELLDDLETRHPGLKFRVVDEQGRIRQHMKLFLGTREVRHLGARLEQHEELHILGALSGG